MNEDPTSQSGTDAAGDRSAGDGSAPDGGRSLGQKLKLAAAAVVGIVVLLLVVQNQEPTQTRFLTWSVEMPRFALLVFVYLLGAATGWFVRRRGGDGR